MPQPVTTHVGILDRGHVQYVMHMGDDLAVVNAARVSFNKHSKEFSERDEKLIGYLAKHNHWTPFAHPQITLRIKAPISIRAQLGKHQVGFVMNEVSRRYVTEEPECYCPIWRSKPTDGAKQGSTDFIEDDDQFDEMCRIYDKVANQAMDAYQELMERGVAPEQARFVLPQGAYTEWWWTGSLAGYARVYRQRIDPHAQWEVREYAEAISKIIQPLYPVSWKALTKQ